MRIHLSGLISVEAGGTLLRPADFPGQQGRAAFAFLVGHRGVPVPRSELAEALWPGGRPHSWDSALSALVSRLRGLLSRVGLDGSEALQATDGCYALHLPGGSWVDHEVAIDAIHEAEAALLAGDPARAYGPSAVAHHIARRPFLPAQEGHWFEQRRDTLTSLLVRALEARAEVYLWNSENALAVEASREVLKLRPFRETGYRLLMRAHAANGNAAEALRTYEECRELIARELGVSPSPETRMLHRDLVQSS